MELLLAATTEILAGELIQQDLILMPEHARLRSRLYDKGAVQDETVDDEGL